MKKHISFVIGLALLSALGTGATAHAAAHSSVPLSGYAWSSTIGWVSFEPSDGSTVTLSTSSPCSVTAACLAGYAWSSNIGWVKFGGLAGQTVAGLTTSDATVNLSTGIVSGWARACAGMDDQVTPPPDQTAPNDTCSGVSRQDGWDGWIELAGTNHPSGDVAGNYGVTYITSGPGAGSFTGYAWGGPVVGWLNFNTNVPVATPGGAVNPNPSPTPGPGGGGSNWVYVSCTPSGTTYLSAPGTVTYHATASGGSGSYQYSWSGSSGSWSSTTVAYPLTSGSYSSTVGGPNLWVRDANDNTQTASASPSCGAITVAASSTGSTQQLLAHKSTVDAGATSIEINEGDPAYLTWNMGSATQCSGEFTPPTGSNWASGVWTNNQPSLSAGPLPISTATNPLNVGTYTFDIKCTAAQTGSLWNIFNIANAGNIITSNSVSIKVKSSSIQEK
ncbi:MAG: hypothetical protein KGI69_02365 [Patescibacteria group bacterium]|nr:hypothetical protein [Patescibacteria group bacterium]